MKVSLHVRKTARLCGWRRRRGLFLKKVDEVRQVAQGKNMVSLVGYDDSFTLYSVGDGNPVDI